MNAPLSGQAGASRTCPHCKATILQSARVCPACRGHLRFDSPTDSETASSFSPLQIEGTLHGSDPGGFEYTLLIVIRNERGEEIGRHVAGVGAVLPGEARSFSVTVEASALSVSKRRRH